MGSGAIFLSQTLFRWRQHTSAYCNSRAAFPLCGLLGSSFLTSIMCITQKSSIQTWCHLVKLPAEALSLSSILIYDQYLQSNHIPFGLHSRCKLKEDGEHVKSRFSLCPIINSSLSRLQRWDQVDGLQDNSKMHIPMSESLSPSSFRINI